MEVIYRQTETLKKLENNPRTITEKQLQKLKESIQRNPDYFEARPIILSDRTGELVIIAGNQRYDACVQLGIKEVPTVLIPNLTEEREREIIIRDNVNNGEWDMARLFEWDFRIYEKGIEVAKTRELRGSSFQVSVINERRALRKEYNEALRYEFTLPLPNNRRWDLDKEILPVFEKL